MPRRRQFLTGLGGSVVAAVGLGGCSLPARLAALPEHLRGRETFHDLSSTTRVVLDGSDNRVLARMALDALQREIAYTERHGLRDLGPANYLAISGGGENGAYGAGLLTAWSELGTRPEFKAVTGVSTGALIAPFAFLGPAYDRELEGFYTMTRASDVMFSRGLLTALLSDSLYDSTPLLRSIRKVLTPAVLDAIAIEYRDKGRLLCVATTNLDVPVGVMWNIGAIAASGSTQRAELIAKILLASASIPGIYPPVMIDLEAGGKTFQEMHVDGGTVAQVVLYPPSFSGEAMASMSYSPSVVRGLVERQRRLYVIRNSRPGADAQTVDRSTLKIVGRAVSTLISTQGIGDLYQLYVLAERDGIDYNVAFIPASFSDKLREPFDREYMRQLYAVGREMMLNGTAWSKYPPGYDPVPINQRRGVVRPA